MFYLRTILLVFHSIICPRRVKDKQDEQDGNSVQQQRPQRLSQFAYEADTSE